MEYNNLKKGKGHPLWEVISSKNEDKIKRIHKRMQFDKRLPSFHLTAYSGLINDPVGLVKHKNYYHIFYQWSPFFPVHGIKHWGHYKTKDFVVFEHTKVAITPSLDEEIDGAYSGGAISHNGKMHIFWTGNVKYSLNSKDVEKDRSSFSLTSVWDDKNDCLIEKKVLFEVDKKYHTGHFRDPLPIIKNNSHFLLHAAQNKLGIGELVLYKSNSIDKGYSFFTNIKFSISMPENIRMVECPDYFEIDGKDVFMFTIQRHENETDPKIENRDKSIALVGKMDWSTGHFDVEGDFQILDWGFDFYAQQAFKTEEPFILGWAVNQGNEQLQTYDYEWAHMLTFPRTVALRNNELIFKPHPSLQKIRGEEIMINGLLRPMEINVDGEFRLTIKQNDDQFAISLKNNLVTLDKREDSNTISQDNKFRIIPINNCDNIQILIDNSIVEIFVDGKVITSKFFMTNPEINFDSSVKAIGYLLNNIKKKW